MADISLRTYIEEVDGMIDRKAADEAIAHCRHILSFYPKHLDTYRLLGKALLEANRHTDAADIFQRVLSAAPDDFIAHVGMSIIREDEASLEAALWHMERAFEVNPANAPIQDELRRLYGRRDGVNPPKARLTRGALARMYSLGELYLQAEAELQAALGEDADRVDLSTILAEVYWRSNRYPEAAKVCSGLLQKLPYSKEGNRVLAKILQAQGRADEAKPYQQRLEALDPYEAFANGQGATQINAETVRLPHLDYSPSLKDPNAPDWVTSIGMKLDEPPGPSLVEQSPDWMHTSTEPEPARASGPTPGAADLPDWLRDMQPSDTEAAVAFAPEAATSSASETPDWLKDLGPGDTLTPEGDQEMPNWLKVATGSLEPQSLPNWNQQPETEATPAPPPAENVPEWMQAAQSSEEVPEWMKAMAPSEATPVAETPAPAENVPEWMQAAQPTEEVPEWTKTMASTEATPVAETPPSAENVPEWMQAAQPTEEVPEWMKTMASTEATPVAETPAPAENVPDWMQAAQPTEEVPEWMKAMAPSEATPVAETPTPAENVPEWMQAAQPAEDAPVAQASTPAGSMPEWMQAAQPAEEVPEWMRAAAPVEESLPWLKSVEPTPSVAPVEPTPAKPPVELPDFLQMASSEAIERANQPVEFESAEEIPEEEVIPAQPVELPDWLKAMAPPTPEAAAPAAPMNEAEALQWAESLGLAASVQPAEMATSAPTEMAAPSEEQAMKPPEWLRRPAASEVEAPTPSAPQPDISTWAQGVGAEPTDTVTNWLASKPVPEWLRQPGEEATTPPVEWMRSPVEEEEGPSPAEPAIVPDWLLAAQTPQAEAVPAMPADAAPATADFDSMSADDAMRWLESLAAQQGAAPEELVTTPEERATTPPEWLSTQPTVPLKPLPEPPATLSVEPPVAEAPAPTTTEPDLSSMSADDAMRWLESLAAQQGAAPEELVTTPEERTTTPPEWVMAKAPAPAVEEPLAEPLVLSSAPSTPEAAAYQATEPDFSTMSADEAMRWLEGLAAQQGAAPEELVTAPEERTTTPPEWVAAQTAEPVIEAPSTPEIAAPSAIEPDFSSMSADDAMRWLEGLAAQQGAAPEELVTAPEERTTTPPEWVVAQTAEPVAETPALAESVTEAPVSFEAPPSPEVAAPSAAEPDFGSMSPDEAMRWLEGLAAQQGAAPEVVSAPAVQPEPTSVPPPTEQPSQITRLSRLAEKLATSRQAREAEIESRFAEERARKEAARLAVQERMEKRKIDTGPLAPRPGTGSLRQPMEASATPSEEVTPTPEAAPPSRPSIGTESTKPKVRPPSKPAPRTRKSLAKSPHAGEAPDNILAHSQQRMLDGDFETAAEGLSYLVSSGQMVDDVIERLEDFAPHQPGAASLLRVLGDAYMRNNQLQKALDVYRQALGQL